MNYFIGFYITMSVVFGIINVFHSLNLFILFMIIVAVQETGERQKCLYH